MQLELRNIKVLASLSEETAAYTATLYVEGRRVAMVSNHGHGGPDEQRWLDRNAEAEVTAYFKTLPAEEHVMGSETYSLQPDLEGWCQDLAFKAMFEAEIKGKVRSIRRAAGKKIVGMKSGGRVVTWKAPADKLEALRARIMEKDPEVRFVADMTDDEIAANIREASRAA